MSYAVDGFEHFNFNVLPRPLSEYIVEFDRLIQLGVSLGVVVDEQPFDGAAVRKVADVARLSEPIRDLARSVGPAVLDATGWDSAMLWIDGLYYKPPYSAKESAVPFHRDMMYWVGLVEPNDAATVIVPLYHERMESGGVGFVAGSQLLASMPVEWTATYPIVAPGEATLHHPLTMHGSLPNETGEPRRSISLHFRHPTVLITR